MSGYFPPYFDSSGLHLPPYADVNQYLLDQYTAIYGQSVSQNISTSDVQSIAIFSLVIYDAYMLAQAVWNGMNPMTAVGTQQDSLYKLNGISRLPATNSTANLTISGVAYTELVNCSAMDSNGNLWDLPPDVIIPGSNSIVVTGTCRTPGPVTAAIGAISVMATQVSGWTGVTNAAAATPGTGVEVDSAFRARQTLSVVLPSQSLFAGTLAAVAAVPGVNRYGGVENPTGSTDSYGNPPHSISVVVEESGVDQAVANAIYLNKTPGCYTNGTTSKNVTDAFTGQSMPIRFFVINTNVTSFPSSQAGYVPIAVTCKVVPMAGFVSGELTLIQNAIANYLQTLQIGETVTISALYGAALSVMPNLSQPQFSIVLMQAAVSGQPMGTVDIPMGFNQVALGNASNITVTT